MGQREEIYFIQLRSKLERKKREMFTVIGWVGSTFYISLIFLAQKSEERIRWYGKGKLGNIFEIVSWVGMVMW